MTLHIRIVDDSDWVGPSIKMILDLVACVSLSPSHQLSRHDLKDVDSLLLCSDDTQTSIRWLRRIRFQCRYRGPCWIVVTHPNPLFRRKPYTRLFSKRMARFHHWTTLHQLEPIIRRSATLARKMTASEVQKTHFILLNLSTQINHH